MIDSLYPLDDVYLALTGNYLDAKLNIQKVRNELIEDGIRLIQQIKVQTSIPNPKKVNEEEIRATLYYNALVVLSKMDSTEDSLESPLFDSYTLYSLDEELKEDFFKTRLSCLRTFFKDNALPRNLCWLLSLQESKLMLQHLSTNEGLSNDIFNYLIELLQHGKDLSYLEMSALPHDKIEKQLVWIRDKNSKNGKTYFILGLYYQTFRPVLHAKEHVIVKDILNCYLKGKNYGCQEASDGYNAMTDDLNPKRSTSPSFNHLDYQYHISKINDIHVESVNFLRLLKNKVKEQMPSEDRITSLKYLAGLCTISAYQKKILVTFN